MKKLKKQNREDKQENKVWIHKLIKSKKTIINITNTQVMQLMLKTRVITAIKQIKTIK